MATNISKADIVFNKDGSVSIGAPEIVLGRTVSVNEPSKRYVDEQVARLHRALDNAFEEEKKLSKPRHVNVMLMEEVHKIDVDKLWASIREFGGG